ncbi:DUF7344 domain-containing protein [Halomarina pelagica]|uniref:DUF7344 domain-containing protein n=1 Tax=Halomarina pelagica TaxID=2961599 RepID=UPI0020C55C64|nr:hypothetical protein [Halomarina sp. BND7]
MSAWDPTTAPDTALGILSHTRRRAVVNTIVGNGGETTRQALVRAVVEEESGQPIGDVETGRIRDVHISLYHNHLPKLSQHGILDHDQETGEVTLLDVEALKATVGTAEETLRTSREIIENFCR